ncbi:hypothetical protein B488_03620 [Liberibacter crescens BT-1]|uniref:DUF177 domain-containing protein n=1 Tax=Liberibacter crescens (strain BT-1) TaxID=1215343 RepID=L0EU25_LIBCB|nr:hypothetical protein [Liberibacter crescens]AGA64355.1 hypothetical protein B488_03620 [Liberibacter crescens BT-1]AMC12551.1 hypothetical protein RL73_01975 [Liberibacter crescens]
MDKNLDSEEAFSYLVKVKSAVSRQIDLKLKANCIEREKLAQLWNVPLVEDLHAELQLVPWEKNGVRAVGTVYAKIIQTCVLTLEPVISLIEETLEYIFVPEYSKLLDTLTDNVDDVASGWQPDIVTFSKDGVIDVGVIISESVALAINLYPKKEGAVFVNDYDSFDNRKVSSFEALKNWKRH